MSDDIQINPVKSDDENTFKVTTPANSAAGGKQDGSAQTGQGGDSSASQSTQQPAGGQAAQTKTGGQKSGNISLLEETDMIAAVADAAPKKRNVPDSVARKFPDLSDLIEQTESMNDDERDYWFQILPIMTDDQIGKFREILLNEKRQLDKLDKEYENKLEKLNEKHMIEWKEFESKEKRAAIAGAEKQAQEEERKKEEELLARLAEL